LQEKIKKIETRIRCLEQNPVVGGYLSLLDKLEEVDSDRILQWKNVDMVMSAYYLYQNEIDKTNGIMVCLGTFKMSNELDIVHGPSSITVSYDSEDAEFRNYVDLEKSITEFFSVPISLYEEFEKKHTVIFPPVYSPESYFYHLQKEFLNDAVSFGQEQAVQNVLIKCFNK